MLTRTATPADIPALRNLDLAASYGARWSDEHYHGLFARADRLKHLLLIAEEEGAIVGYLVASGVGAEWELENVVVAASRLRQGIARTLIEELSVRLLQEAVARIHLEVRESNQAARALYASLGFAEENRRKQYYTNPIEDAVVLAVALQF